jgi:hypothetical protein
MYSTCLFCNQSLGANEAIEAFPVGRRLAFDQRRGRLWVVCRKCEKWNLTPLEERWDAIEACERLFRDTRKRVSTENIGLARLTEGLELVRIGEPMRPEFAAWRYGDQFGRRRQRQMVMMTGVGLLGVGFWGLNVANMMAGVGGSLGFTVWQAIHTATSVYQDRRIITKVRDTSDKLLVVRRADAFHSRLVPGVHASDWNLQLKLGAHGRRGKPLLTGDEARRVAARVIPHINRYGSKPAQTAAAVKRIESAGNAEHYLAWAARHTWTWRDASTEIWLGIEMAINEENERRALEDELELLDAAWREAEEIAAISDRLVFPSNLEATLTELKQKHGASNTQRDGEA